MLWKMLTSAPLLDRAANADLQRVLT